MASEGLRAPDLALDMFVYRGGDGLVGKCTVLE